MGKTANDCIEKYEKVIKDWEAGKIRSTEKESAIIRKWYIESAKEIKAKYGKDDINES